MNLDLRPGAAFHGNPDNVGRLEFHDGARFDGVTFKGAVPARADDGGRAFVNVFSAVYPSSDAAIGRREHFPAIVVVPVETRPLHQDREILSSLFYLPLFVDGGAELDSMCTVVLPMHGSVEADDGDTLRAGSPTLHGVAADTWIYLDAASVAQLIGHVHGPGGERPTAIVNIGCFSSSRPHGRGVSFNEELANLLEHANGVAVYGPPHAGVVTSSTRFGEWRSFFSQPREVADVVRDVPIKLQRIAPAKARRRHDSPQARPGVKSHGAVVITNSFVLASAVASCSPDFAAPKKHEFDRQMME